MALSGRPRLDSARSARLVEASRILNSTVALSDLLDFIIREAAALTGAEAASILLLDPDTRELRFRATSDDEAAGQLADFPVPLDGSVAGAVFQNDEPLIVGDVSREPRWNPDVSRMTGIKTRSILGVPMHNASAETVGVIEALNKVDGSFGEHDVETLATLADLAGVAVERARLVEELRLAYQQLNELDQLKSEFIALASHELRTPLSVILGYVSYLREKADNSAMASQLDSVLRAAVRLRDLIQDMLNLRYIDTGELQLTLEKMDFAAFVGEVVAGRDETAEAKRIAVHLELPEEPVYVIADREGMELVVHNLLTNAIKFTPLEGHISICLHDRGNEAWLSVKDTGIGIPADQLERIFHRFYQVEPHLGRSYEGFGLGLAVVRDLLEAQGGRVWVNSEEGEGSEFVVAIPAA